MANAMASPAIASASQSGLYESAKIGKIGGVMSARSLSEKFRCVSASIIAVFRSVATNFFNLTEITRLLE